MADVFGLLGPVLDRADDGAAVRGGAGAGEELQEPAERARPYLAGQRGARHAGPAVAANLREHISCEQSSLRPRLRLSDAGAHQLGAEAEQARRRAPTRPHPRAAPDPAPPRAAAPAAATPDKARNAVVRRP